MSFINDVTTHELGLHTKRAAGVARKAQSAITSSVETCTAAFRALDHNIAFLVSVLNSEIMPAGWHVVLMSLNSVGMLVDTWEGPKYVCYELTNPDGNSVGVWGNDEETLPADILNLAHQVCAKVQEMSGIPCHVYHG